MSDTPNDAPLGTPDESEPRERASLRGRGWEILRGQAEPADEAAAAAAPPDVLPEETRAPVAAAVPEAEAIPRVERLSAPPVDAPTSGRAEVEALTPVLPETLSASASDGRGPVFATGEAQALEETGGPVSLTPLSGPADLNTLQMEGAIIRPQDARIDAGQLITGGVVRPPASELFSASREVEPDSTLLAQFVTDARIEKLWQDIEKLQEEIVTTVQGDRQLTDVYQKELLQASALLLQDRANYDDVRAILYRVRADLSRESKVRADTEQYKPQILRYLLFMAALWLLLMGLEPLFRDFIVNVVQIEPFASVYHPMLFGMLGAIVNAYFTLNQHAIQLRDFDPVHTSWYLMNPVIGLIMGLLMTLVFGTGIVSTIGVSDQAQMAEYPFLLWVFCFLAGYNQNLVLRLLDRMFRAVRGAGSQSDSGSSGSSSQQGQSSPSGD